MTHCVFIEISKNYWFRKSDAEDSCVLVYLGSQCRCTVVFLFPVGHPSPMCSHLGESLVDLWDPFSQSFTGSETLRIAFSNHHCPIT